MVDSLWFVLALVLLAVVSVALVLVLVLRREEAHGQDRADALPRRLF